MIKVYQVIAVILAIGALGQIIEGFAHYFSLIDEILFSDGHFVNPSSFEMFREGLLGLASAAPTLLISAIFFHMQTLVDAISRPIRLAKLKEIYEESK